MRNKLLKIVADTENYMEELKKLKNSKQYSESFKKEKISKLEEEFKENTNSAFDEISESLSKEESSIKDKLQELRSGEYDKRSYLYNKAVNEMSNYNDISEFLSQKLNSDTEQLEKFEARSAALSKAKASDKAEYEQLKQIVADNMSDDERALRTDLAKVDIRRQNLKGAKSSFNYDLKNNDIDLLKTTFTAYGDSSDLDEKAAKKIADTIAE